MSKVEILPDRHEATRPPLSRAAALPEPLQRTSEDLLKEMARDWYGYGRWEAPLWFVGLEPGGSQVNACAQGWEALGKGELLDVEQHHQHHRLENPAINFFGERPRIQPTWAKLIWFLLAYRGRPNDREATRAYQKSEFCRDGRSAILELSSLPAKHMGVASARDEFLEVRVARLRDGIRACAPECVVFYSTSPRAMRAWAEIAGQTMIANRPVRLGQTVAVVTPHPRAAGKRSYWTDLASTVRELTLPPEE